MIAQSKAYEGHPHMSQQEASLPVTWVGGGDEARNRLMPGSKLVSQHSLKSSASAATI
jgi:hypothetical protein